MIKIFILVVSLFFFNKTCTFAQGEWTSLKGSGKVVTLKPNVIDFDKISTDISCKMRIEVGKAKSLEIDIDDNLSNLLDIQEDEKEHKLTLKLDLKKTGKNSWVQSANIVVRITLPEMSVFTQNSNGDTEIEGLNGRYFRAENYGNGDIILRGGKVDVFDIDSKGNGDVNAVELTAMKVNVSLRGNGQIRFDATDSYEAKLDGNGDIQNVGTGKAAKIDRIGNGRVSDEKLMKRYQGAVDEVKDKIKIRFQNNSAVPRKIAFIFYEPSQNGSNSTVIKVLMPFASASFKVEVGTRFYNANEGQVGTVMGGGKLKEKPLYIVEKGDDGKWVKIY